MSSSSLRSAGPVRTEPAAVRTARFDRALHSGAAGGFGDAEVTRQVQVAVEQGLEQGRAAGFAAGWAQGRRAAAEEAEAQARRQAADDAVRRAAEAARVGELLDGLARAVAEVEITLAPAWQEIADTVTDGVLALARAAIGHELAHLDDARLSAVRAAVRALGAPGTADVHLSPADHALLVETLAAGAGAGAGAGTGTGAAGALPEGVRLHADPELAPGEVRAATPTQRLRMHLPTALAAAEEVLRG